MSTRVEPRGSRSSRPRTSKACLRCHHQKIKCNGDDPCQQCMKRGLECHFHSRPKRTRVTRSSLQKPWISEEVCANSTASASDSQPRSITPAMPLGLHISPGGRSQITDSAFQSISEPLSTIPGNLEASALGTAGEASFTNPLAFSTANWVKSSAGKPLFMGTSSNWSFGRRVLAMTYEQLHGTTLPPDNFLFDENIYDMGWNGQRDHLSQEPPDLPILPNADFALHLIDIAKFHCGDLVYLFDEAQFMKQFAAYQKDPQQHSHQYPLWYAHYLLILAFGKAFGTSPINSQWPPGINYFVQALKVMPDFAIFEADPIEAIQVLCCKALYLQCLNRRGAAHRVIGEALRMALEKGMHTEMCSPLLEEAYVEKCRILWWTVYILERQMSSLMGIPMGIADTSISTPFPSLPDRQRGSDSLQIQVRLSQVLSKIDKTVYGIEGMINSTYLRATQSALRNLADVADRLNSSFSIRSKEELCGISRLSAYLHLFQHQCIGMCTRPLLYIFLQSKIGQSDASALQWLESDNVKTLLQVCIDSSLQSIRILHSLLNQGLLEIFLPFDLDATFTSAMSIIMAAAIDPTLVPDYSLWSQGAYTILDEMASRRNTIASMIKAELRQLESQLNQLASNESPTRPSLCDTLPEETDHGYSGEPILSEAFYASLRSTSLNFEGDSDMHCYLSADQLTQIANSLDLDPWQ